MLRKAVLFLFIFSLSFSSCWRYRSVDPPGNTGTNYTQIKVLGYKPVYGEEPAAKKILYKATASTVIQAGNIYAFRNYIFQIDPGYGIHVIDNSIPADAKRIGFIEVKGCSQISIKNDKLYTNSYDDLVVLDFSDLNNVHEISRAKAVFVEYRNYSPIAQPPGTGYFECPDYGKFVVGWTRDSVIQSCYK